MKLITCTITTLMCHFAHASVETDIQNYLKIAEQKQLHQDITWQRLMYADQSQKSEVTYDGYFYAKDGKNNLKNELQADIKALFIRPLAKIIFQPTPCCKLQQLNSDVNPCVYAYFDNV